MAKHTEQTNVRLDEQARKDAQTIVARYNLTGMAAAIRFALREMARRIEAEKAQQSAQSADTPEPASGV